MRKIREVLRLKWAVGMSNRWVALSCGIGRPTVSEHLRRAESAGLGCPVPEHLSDARLDEVKAVCGFVGVEDQARCVKEGFRVRLIIHV